MSLMGLNACGRQTHATIWTFVHIWSHNVSHAAFSSVSCGATANSQRPEGWFLLVCLHQDPTMVTLDLIGNHRKLQ